MKFFTPERYAALQDFSSDAAMDAADAAWDQAAEDYTAYYRSVEAALPQGMRRLQTEYYLHDAQVLYLGQQGNRFLIALRLDVPPQPVLQLSYELTTAPRIDREALSVAVRSGGPATWQYDEVELLTAPSCVHSILLSNGWEVQLPFRDLRFEEIQVLLPAPRNEAQGAPAFPVTETV